MKLPYRAALFSVVALAGTGAILLRAQQPQPASKTGKPPARAERDKLRAEIVQLRTEVEMLKFDYELARGRLSDEVKMVRGLQMIGPVMEMMGSIQGGAGQPHFGEPGIGQPAAGRGKGDPFDADAEPEAGQDAKKAADAAEAGAEERQKSNEAAITASVAEGKKELARLYMSLAEKQLDLEDAERHYRELAR